MVLQFIFICTSIANNLLLNEENNVGLPRAEKRMEAREIYSSIASSLCSRNK